jgi:hypothetical protein
MKSMRKLLGYARDIHEIMWICTSYNEIVWITPYMHEVIWIYIYIYMYIYIHIYIYELIPVLCLKSNNDIDWFVRSFSLCMPIRTVYIYILF